MIELTGKYTDCKIFTDYCEDQALSQVYGFLNNEAFENKRTRFMPDIHAGSGAVIGTTVELGSKVIPNIVGVDIGCGMLSYKLDTKIMHLDLVDDFIHNNIPSGFNINKQTQELGKLEQKIIDVSKEIGIQPMRALRSVGSLGGGNHFIEIGQDEEGSLWLTIHSGSRNFGLQIAKYHQKIAENYSLASISEDELKAQIEDIKKKYSGKRIATEIEKLKKRSKVRKHKRTGLEYLEGPLAEDYIRHMKVAQEYASLNRKIMADKIVAFLQCNVIEKIESVHNYIDFSDNIVRKGAISAHEDKKVIIPWNMRDGLIIGKGKGNPDWNFSAPHGAGRVMSRSKAKDSIKLKDFKDSMQEVYTSCVSKDTIDESPMAYKDHTEIELYLEETVEIIYRVKPIYNFKAN